MIKIGVHRFFLISGVLLFILTLIGCRTYGGYGTERETIEQIMIANEEFADELSRARSMLPIYEREVSGTVPTFIDRYQEIVLAHSTILEYHRVLAEEVEDGAGYRTLNRVFGSILSEQEMIRNRYKELLYVAYPENQNVADVPGDVVPEGRYIITPPFYRRVANMGSPWPMTGPVRADTAAGAIETEDIPRVAPEE